MRRLITLISADWCRTIVIRRELPRTRSAGWVRRPYHLERTRILLSTRPRCVTGSVAISKTKTKSTNHPAVSAPSGDERPAISTIQVFQVFQVFRRHGAQAAMAAAANWLSMRTAMAQMNPSSSRPTAVTIWFLFLPLAASFL